MDMNSSACTVVESSRNGEIIVNIDSLERIIQELSAALRTLTERLQPVLVSNLLEHPQAPKTLPSDKAGLTSEVSTRIIGMRTGVQCVIDLLMETVEALEL